MTGAPNDSWVSLLRVLKEVNALTCPLTSWGQKSELNLLQTSSLCLSVFQKVLIHSFQRSCSLIHSFQRVLFLNYSFHPMWLCIQPAPFHPYFLSNHWSMLFYSGPFFEINILAPLLIVTDTDITFLNYQHTKYIIPFISGCKICTFCFLARELNLPQYGQTFLRLYNAYARPLPRYLGKENEEGNGVGNTMTRTHRRKGALRSCFHIAHLKKKSNKKTNPVFLLHQLLWKIEHIQPPREYSTDDVLQSRSQ